MYTRQKKSQLAIGYNGLGQVPSRKFSGLGQVPSNTITVTMGSTKVSLTGPANETSTAAALVAMLNSAVSAAASGKLVEAQAVLANAKGMLPATGSLRAQVEPLLEAAQKQVGGKGISPMLIAGAGVALVAAFLLLRR